MALRLGDAQGFNTSLSPKYSFNHFKPLSFHSFVPVLQNKNLDGSTITSQGQEVEGFILHPWNDRPSAVLLDLNHSSTIEGHIAVAITGTSASSIQCWLEIDGIKKFTTDILTIKSPPFYFKEQTEGARIGQIFCNDALDGNSFDHVLITGITLG